MLQALHWARSRPRVRSRTGHRLRNWVISGRRRWYINWRISVGYHCWRDDFVWNSGFVRFVRFVSGRRATLNSTSTCWAACRRKAGIWTAHGLAAGEARWECNSYKRRQELSHFDLQCARGLKGQLRKQRSFSSERVPGQKE